MEKTVRSSVDFHKDTDIPAGECDAGETLTRRFPAVSPAIIRAGKFSLKNSRFPFKKRGSRGILVTVL